MIWADYIPGYVKGIGSSATQFVRALGDYQNSQIKIHFQKAFITYNCVVKKNTNITENIGIPGLIFKL